MSTLGIIRHRSAGQQYPRRVKRTTTRLSHLERSPGSRRGQAMTSVPDDDIGRAIRNWQLEGSDLTKPMKIDFFVAVPSEKSGDDFARALGTSEFAVFLEQDEETAAWTCYCTKTMTLNKRPSLTLSAGYTHWRRTSAVILMALARSGTRSLLGAGSASSECSRGRKVARRPRALRKTSEADLIQFDCNPPWQRPELTATVR